MDFELTDEQQLIREAVREFAEAEVTPIAAEIDRDHRCPHELLPKLAEMNLMGMPYPEKAGGAGADYVSYIIAVEELSRACASTGVILSAHTSLAPAGLKFGTEAQQDRHDMASGRRLGAFAHRTRRGHRCRRGYRHGHSARRRYASTGRRCSSPTRRSPKCTSSSRTDPGGGSAG
jgi:alkylation response protein AidB-like acyl-CoA dehydrogenase